MSGVEMANTKLDAAKHIRMTARRLGVLVASTINDLGDPLIIRVGPRGEAVFNREGQWSTIYRQPQARIEDLRWREVGLLLDRCEALGYKF